MKLSTRLTRAGAAFVVFGLVASAVPNSALIPASACGSSSSNDTGAWIAGGVVLAGGAYFLTHPHAGGKKGSDNSNPDNNQTSNPESNTNQWNDLHSFVYGNQ